MLITRLYLCNYRVYEGAHELALPPGLVGIYGPNGAGKSALVESILWTLWGKTRTTKDEVRTSGVNADCVTEVEFEHEGHLYLVRRTLTGIGHTVKAEAWADGLQVAEGVRDTGRYVHSILGMDDVAFRASVFAEQKQLAAFSQHSPNERRRLVQQLLGITPLEGARDRARKDARTAEEHYVRLRGVLADLAALRVAVDDAAAEADAVEVEARSAETLAATARQREQAARTELDRVDEVRQRHEVLLGEGKGARREQEELTNQVALLAQELAQLDGATGRLAALAPVAAAGEGAEARLLLVAPVLSAAAGLAALPAQDPPPAPDEEGAEAARLAAEEAGATLAELDGRLAGARAAADTARAAGLRAADLSGEEGCPLCGQALGRAFAQVQAHRAAESTAAEAEVRRLEGERSKAAAASRATAAAADAARAQLRHRQAAWEAFRRHADRRATALEAYEAAVAALGGAVDVAAVEAEHGRLQLVLRQACEALDESLRLEGRLERRPELTAQLEAATQRAAHAAAHLEGLRAEVKALGFDPDVLAAAQAAHRKAAGVADAAQDAGRQARLVAERAKMHAEAELKRLADAEAQHALIADLGEESRHLNRLAELLNAFRNAVVATVGPRLAMQAADLFGELTDQEYDRLEVDPETYELQIRDAGIVYGMARFSGSETDLANLALRVAISEHVRFQSGGAVGLLVLDEVFGPLDDDRKERMLLALERLRGRFRQVLVVTHATEIKEQLPNAIQVIKLPGRRATARVMGT